MKIGISLACTSGLFLMNIKISYLLSVLLEIPKLRTMKNKHNTAC